MINRLVERVYKQKLLYLQKLSSKKDMSWGKNTKHPKYV